MRSRGTSCPMLRYRESSKVFLHFRTGEVSGFSLCPLWTKNSNTEITERLCALCVSLFPDTEYTESTGREYVAVCAMYEDGTSAMFQMAILSLQPCVRKGTSLQPCHHPRCASSRLQPLKPRVIRLRQSAGCFQPTATP